MSIRPASMMDRDAIIGFANVGADMYPHMRRDRDKIKEGVTTAISSAKHFCWVAEHNDKVTGVLIGLTADSLWAQRNFCAVVLWIAGTPATGAALLRQFKSWVTSRRGIRIAGFSPDLDVDARVWQLAERIGFKKRGGAYLYIN